MLRIWRFRRGDLVSHRLNKRKGFVVLRRVLLPLGGYLVRGFDGERPFRCRFRDYELDHAKGTAAS